jgi:outer membrane protein assembly factor BamD
MTLSTKPMSARLSTLFGFCLMLCVLVVLGGCEPPPISSLSAEEGIARIRENHTEERFDLVTSDVTEYRSRYPYSKFAAEAELLQGDAFFQLGRYPEAIATYDAFLAKFPKHEKASLALFRTGLSLDRQSPEAVNREQRYSERALETYGSYLERYPSGPEMKEVRERIQVLRERIAGHYLFIARFYWKKDLYHAALSRYTEILRKFPMFEDMRKEALERVALCYERLADEQAKDPSSDALKIFKDETPDGLRKRAADVRKRGVAALPKEVDEADGDEEESAAGSQQPEPETTP